MNFALLSFSFLQGILAFFAPCAVALLPGYLSAFLTREQNTKTPLWIKILLFSSLTILGIITIYALAGILIFSIASIIKQYMVYVVLIMAIIIILFGIMMLMGKSISLPIHSPRVKAKAQFIEAYLFGIAYAIGSLGCLFPLFLVVMTSALQAGAEGILYLIAYAIGMSIFMILFYSLAVAGKQFLHKWLNKFMPYVLRIGGAIVIAAGIYIIWYQSALL